MRQAYWRLGEGWSLRFRRTGDAPPFEDTLTVKGDRHGLEAVQFSISLTPADGVDRQSRDTFFSAAGDHQVVKTRQFFQFEGRTWRLDVFSGRNAGLVVAELEGQDEAELESVMVPPWAQREVTAEHEYNNEQLAYRPFKDWN